MGIVTPLQRYVNIWKCRYLYSETVSCNGSRRPRVNQSVFVSFYETTQVDRRQQSIMLSATECTVFRKVNTIGLRKDPRYQMWYNWGCYKVEWKCLRCVWAVAILFLTGMSLRLCPDCCTGTRLVYVALTVVSWLTKLRAPVIYVITMSTAHETSTGQYSI